MVAGRLVEGHALAASDMMLQRCIYCNGRDRKVASKKPDRVPEDRYTRTFIKS